MRNEPIPANCTTLLSKVGVPCTYCDRPMTELGKTQVTRDHIYAKSKGYSYGSFKGNNKAWCCSRCNHSKKDRNILEWWGCLMEECDPRSEIVFQVLVELRRLGIVTQGHAKKHVWERFISKYRVLYPEYHIKPQWLVDYYLDV